MLLRVTAASFSIELPANTLSLNGCQTKCLGPGHRSTFPDSCFWLSPSLVVVGIWELNQWGKKIHCPLFSLPSHRCTAFQINKYNFTEEKNVHSPKGKCIDGDWKGETLLKGCSDCYWAQANRQTILSHKSLLSEATTFSLTSKRLWSKPVINLRIFPFCFAQKWSFGLCPLFDLLLAATIQILAAEGYTGSSSTTKQVQLLKNAL